MPLPDISRSSWAGIMAAVAIVGTCWRAIYGWLQRLADLVICRVVFKDDVARAVMSRAWRMGKRSPFGLRLFSGLTSYVFPKRRVEVIGYEDVTSEPLVFLVGRVPVLIGSGFAYGGSATQPNIGNTGDNTRPVTLRYLRGTLDIETFVDTAITEYNALRQAAQDASQPRTRRFNVTRMYGPGGRPQEAYGGGKGELAVTPRAGSSNSDTLTQLQRGEMRLIRWQPQDLIERSTDAAPFVNHPISPEMLAEFDEVYTWIKREQWFRAKGAAWYRGYLLHGPSGSGKSTIVRNVAIRHDLPVYTFDLSTYDNRSFADDWKQVLQNAPAIALLEDLDCCFHLRENIAVKDKTRDGLTFDCLLNTLSGVGSSDGVLLFVTTNHIESLDAALGIPDNGHNRSTRPGRINRAIYVGAMQERERRLLASHILSDFPELIEDTVRAGNGEMAAQFQERCVQLAVHRFWTEGVKGEVEEPPPRPEPRQEIRLALARAMTNAAAVNAAYIARTGYPGHLNP